MREGNSPLSSPAPCPSRSGSEPLPPSCLQALPGHIRQQGSSCLPSPITCFLRPFLVTPINHLGNLFWWKRLQHLQGPSSQAEQALRLHCAFIIKHSDLSFPTLLKHLSWRACLPYCHRASQHPERTHRDCMGLASHPSCEVYLLDYVQLRHHPG